ncbi:MAG TPA: SMR family transporter [Rubrivivax sp.]|nr:SMR family transporter [Rubrivivax sp.]
MKSADFAWVLSGVLLNAVAQLLLKAGAASAGQINLAAGAPALWRTATGLALHPAILGGLACYAISVVVWIVALSRVEVSIAYPMLSIGYVVNALLAWWLFGEDLNAQRWLGIGVIIVGVVLVARSGGHS